MSNIFIIVSGIGSLQSFLFAILVSLKKSKKRSDWILFCWFLTFTIHLCIGIIHSISPINVIDILIMTISFLHGPFFFIYSKSVIQKPLTKIDLLHFAPFVLFTLLCFYVDDIHTSTWEITTLIPKLVSLILYPTYILFWFHKNITLLKSKTAHNSILELYWIKTIAILFLISILLSIIRLSTELIVGVSYFELVDVLRYVILVIVIGFFGIRYGVVYTLELHQNYAEEGKKYQNSPLKKGEITNYEEKVNLFFQENSAYLDSNFSLAILSGTTGIPKHHLSQIINAEMNTTFYDLVNSKRVQHAIERLQHQNSLNLTLEGLGYECGFNSKSAFFHHFKKHTGKTPGQFRKEIGTD